jgi:hypothetical protein
LDVAPRLDGQRNAIEKAQNLIRVVSPGKTLWKDQASDAEYAEGPASERSRLLQSCESIPPNR